MKKMLMWMIAFAALSVHAVRAQNIVGDWQGTVKSDVSEARRIVLHITKHESCDLTAMVFRMDQPPDGFGVTGLTVRGSELRFSVDPLHINLRRETKRQWFYHQGNMD